MKKFLKNIANAQILEKQYTEVCLELETIYLKSFDPKKGNTTTKIQGATEKERVKKRKTL